MWKRAVWKEGSRDEEGVVPSSWIKGKLLFWPPGKSAVKALKERKAPEEGWLQFQLIKIKYTSGMSIF